MKTRTLISILLVLFLVASPVFARGAKEVQENEKFVKVVSVTEDNGHYDINGIYEDGTEVIYHTSDETVSLFPPSSFEPGTILLIKDSGTMTMSIPPQLNAVEIRNVALGLVAGVYNPTFPEPVVENLKPVLSFADVDLEDVISGFNYGYGYLVMQNILMNGVTLDGGYFALGVLDACDFYAGKDPLYTEEVMNLMLDQYASEYLYAGKTIDKGVVMHNIDEVKALAEPADLESQFSYSYGWLTTFDLIYAGYDIHAPEYLQGLLSYLYEAEPLVGLLEMETLINNYVEHMNKLYEEAMAGIAEQNIAANAIFLEENKKVEGVIVYDSGLQVLVRNANGNGVKPSATDTINCDYTLSLLDGTIADKAAAIEFDLASLIPGFVEAVTNMEVGQSITAYIPPELGYGDQAYGPIAPNALLIFDITLNSIVE